jgi:nickel transport protein
MRGRILVLTLTLSAALGLAGEARAHRLKAACRVLPGRVVRVESWFDNGETPKKGHVQVRGPGGRVLVEGQLDREGLFQFDAPAGQALQVVVEAGEGHRAEVAISPEQVEAVPPPEKAAPPEDGPSPGNPPTPARHEVPVPIKDKLTGVALLIAVAAFVLSRRNARRIRERRRRYPV